MGTVGVGVNFEIPLYISLNMGHVPNGFSVTIKSGVDLFLGKLRGDERFGRYGGVIDVVTVYRVITENH